MNLFLLLLSTALAAQAQPSPATVSQLSDYQNWGWGEVIVLENGLVALAMAPRIGARVMQYDLGAHQGLFLNPAEIGKLYEPTRTSPWHNYGGYKNWPAPQDRWDWPPPHPGRRSVRKSGGAGHAGFGGRMGRQPGGAVEDP